MAQRTAYSRLDLEGGAIVTTITADPGVGGTSISIADATGWPDGSAGHFFAVIDPGGSSEEKIDVTSRSSTTLTVGARGQDGTSAGSHAAGTAIQVCFTATEADEANYWVNKLAGAANAAGDLPYADNDNSLTRLAIGTAGLVLKTNAGATAPEWGQVDTAGIAADAIDGTLIEDDAVDSEHIATGAIDLDHMSANSVDSDQYVDGSIDTAHIANLQITTGLLAADAVTSAKIADDQIDSEHIAAGAIDSEHFAAGAVDASAIAANAVDSSEIAADAVGISEAADAVLVQVIPFSRSGTLTTGTGTMAYRAPVALTLKHVRLYCTTAPTGTTSTPITGEALVVDVNKNGTTVFTTQANRPSITASANSETATTAPDVTAVAAGDRITVDIDFVGSLVAGADLVVNVYAVLA